MKRKIATVRVKVFGDYALFTRPEGKVERVSYPLITPSAARGVLESLLWKPEFMYKIRKISVLKPPKFYSIVRNEVSKKATINKKFMKSPQNVFADKMRQLRHSLVLKDVSYVIEADIVLKPTTKDPVEKYVAIFNRRVEKGQCFYRPYLGAREFAANFTKVDHQEQPIEWTDSLGTMFFDFRYSENMAIPYFFQANIQNGVMTIPDYLYEEVYK